MRGAMSASPAAATRTASSSRSDGRVLEQEAGGADAQRLEDVLAGVEGREHHDRRGVLRVGEDPLGRREPVELGHADVHQHDVGAPAGDDVDRGVAVGRLADDGDVGLGVEDDAKAGAQQALVVGDDDGDRAQRRRPRAPGGASSPSSSSRQRTSAVATDSEMPLTRKDPAGRMSSATRGPAIWLHDLGGEDLARPGGVAQAAGDDDRRPVEVARPRTAARRRRCRCAPRGRRPRRWSARCMATAQRTAATALEKVTMSPSPVDLTSRPSWLGDDLAQHREVPGAPRVGLVVAVAVVERRRADDVGEHDRDERRLHGAEHLRPCTGGVSPQRVNRARHVHPAG